jgi:hypothetical protein
MKEFGVAEGAQRVTAQADNLSRLLESLPLDKKYQSTIDVLKKGTASAQKDHEQLVKDIKAGKPIDPLIASAMDTIGVDPNVEVTSIGEALLGQLSARILQDAEKEQKRRERIVHRLTVAGYILYPLGVILALIGKLYGQEIPGVD